MAGGETRIGVTGITVFVLSYLFAAASGLLIAPLLALAGMAVFPFRREDWAFRDFPWPIVPAALFLLWVGLSFLWSPYDNPEQLPKTLLGIPLYILFAYRVGSLKGRWKSRVETCIIFFAIALGLTLLSEAITDGAVTRSFKVTAEDVSQIDMETIRVYVYRSLGHAAVPLILLAGPAAMIAWREGGPVIGGLILLIAGWVAFSFETEVNAAAFVLASLAAMLAYIWPRTVISVLFGALAGAFIVLPLIMPGLISALPDSFREALPLSWLWRLEIWSFAGELVQEKLWFGYGLDASRVLNGEMNLAGYNIERLPHHPHNAALQVWLETGLVGSLLLAYTLVAIGGRIAMSSRLSKLQAVSIVWVLMIYVSLIFFSYGVWQEWHQAAVALAATAVLFLGAKSRHHG